MFFHGGVVSLHRSITNSIRTACSKKSRRIEIGKKPSDVSLDNSLLAMYAECRISGISTYDLVTRNGPWVDPEGGGQTRSVKSVNLNKLKPGIVTGLALLLAVYKLSPSR
jgi:hypothetical protein